MRLIDADAIPYVDLNGDMPQSKTRVYVAFKEKIDRLPTIDPVKHGKWIEEPNCWYRCTNCGQHYPSIRGYMDYSYCPNCGAKMEE